MGSTGTLPMDNGTLKGLFCVGSLKRKTMSAIFTATNTSSAPKEDIPATILISPNSKKQATAAITTNVVTQGTFCAFTLVINFGSSPTLAIPNNNLLMEMIPLNAALAVANNAATAKTTGSQELRFDAAKDNGESTFEIAKGSAMLSTVKEMSN